MPARFSYACFDFRLRSDLALVELGSVYAGDDRPVVDVRLGAVPEALAGAGPPFRGVQAAGNEALLHVEGVARYLVRKGDEIVVDPAPGASERNVRLFLLGSALGVVCHLRGLLPLHANAVVAQGGAYAFAGPSGAGKSTLAAHFARRGYDVLCDDVCVVSFDASGAPLAWPGLPRLKLWADAAQAFGHDSAVLDRVIDGQDKYHVPLPLARELGPVPLRRLYLLERCEEEAASTIAPLHGHRSMKAAMSQTYRGGYLKPMGLIEQNFRQCLALVNRTGIYQARRAWGFEAFEQQAGLLEQHLLNNPG